MEVFADVIDGRVDLQHRQHRAALAFVAADNPHHAEVTRIMRAGDLVPDQLVIDIFTHDLVEREIPESDFLIIDGLPRNRAQVGLIKRHVEVVKIFKLSVYDEGVVFDRLLNRARRERRSDDTEEVIRHRLEVYRNETESCIEAYPGTILTRIQANQPIFDVHLDIMHALHKMRDIHFA